MDQAKFDDGQRLYDAGDFRGAAKVFLAAAGRGADANGAAYHMAGNSLMRLRRWKDAVAVYGHALRDQTYTKRGAVYANLGRAFSQLAEYADAVDAYALALRESDYRTPYKALSGMADALCESGKIEDAAVAYRQAALEPGNPDPGKALVNLGLCFMALGRASDAADSYKAALGFDNFQGRGKALANLGIAYAALGDYEEAVKSFQKATQLHGYELSPAAADAFAQSKKALGPGSDAFDSRLTGEMVPVVHGATDTTPAPNHVEGWETGELAAMPPVGSAPMPASSVPYGDDAAAHRAAADLGFGDDAAVESFFSLTEDEMKQRGRDARREARSEKRASRNPWVIVGAVVGVLVATVAVGAALFYFGIGWPTQGQMVDGLLSAHAKGQPVDTYWVAVPTKDVTKEMAKIPPVDAFKIESVQRGPTSSTAIVTVTPKAGAPLRYKITLQREGVGWRVSGVDNDWQSTGG